MNKQDKKLIAKLIKGLPAMQHKDLKQNVTVQGHRLIEQGVIEIDSGKDKTEIKPDGVYLVARPKQINHKTEAENVFKHSGLAGVVEYCRQVVEISQTTATE